MTHFKPDGRSPRGWPALLCGATMMVCFAAIVSLPVLRGPPLTRFLVYFFLAAVAYAMAVAWLDRTPPSLRVVWTFALLFRLILLLTSPPTLSDDVYRYIWDGRLANAGVSPYAHAVDSPLLDRFDSPQRALVNNSWMASPYLPVAQALFVVVYRLAPDSPLTFQIIAVLLDLLTGWLATDLLRRLSLPRERVLIYLWNPLVVVEFAHGAHVDALMICLMMLALWALSAAPRLSPPALAAATLTKGIPGLLLPVVTWRWGWRRTLIYIGLVIAVLVPFALGAGWGLTGPRNGEGLFGALRIYTAHWNYNGGLYHWLEVTLSGYRTPGAVPPEIVGEAPIRAAKLTMGVILGLVLTVVGWKGRRCNDDVGLLRLAVVPLAAYLLLTTTVHPWYVTLVIPLLPFLLPKKDEKTPLAGGSPTLFGKVSDGMADRRERHRRREGPGRGPSPNDGASIFRIATRSGRFLWPWLYFSAAVALSYLTYLDPANLREHDWVRLVEYVPLYLLLLWSAWPASGVADAPGAN
jgi:alpha-1,6-mannosyltransferase